MQQWARAPALRSQGDAPWGQRHVVFIRTQRPLLPRVFTCAHSIYDRGRERGDEERHPAQGEAHLRRVAKWRRGVGRHLVPPGLAHADRPAGALLVLGGGALVATRVDLRENDLLLLVLGKPGTPFLFFLVLVPVEGRVIHFRKEFNFALLVGERLIGDFATSLLPSCKLRL